MFRVRIHNIVGLLLNVRQDAHRQPMTNARRVVLIAHSFPPTGGVSVAHVADRRIPSPLHVGADRGRAVVGTEINASGKLHDYVGRDHQVPAVVPEGDAAQVLRGLDWGVIAAPRIDGVAGGIREVTAAQPERTVADPEGHFDWAKLTSVFAAAFDRAVTSRTERSSGDAGKGADGESRVAMVK